MMYKVESLDPLFQTPFLLVESFEEKFNDLIYKISKKIDSSSKDTVYILSLQEEEGLFFHRKKRLMKLRCFKKLKSFYNIKGWSRLQERKLLLKPQLTAV